MCFDCGVQHWHAVALLKIYLLKEPEFNLLHKNLSKMHFVLNFQLAIIRNVFVFQVILFGGGMSGGRSIYL